MTEKYITPSFLASALHEIRTPIQTVIGTLELLADTKLDKEQKEYVRQIQFSADVLLSFANDILDYAKMQSGQYKIEHIPFNITKIAEQVVDLITIEAHSRGIDVITDIDYNLPPYIMGDPTRTQQILLNLVKNAVKFTQEGYVRVSINLSEKKDFIICKVEDSGIGIPKEKQQFIFKSYYQVDSSNTRKQGGTGLGLAISQSLVSIMGGEIGMTDNPKGGSIFYFTLPCILPKDEFLPGPQMPRKIPKGKILLVDNNPIFLDSLVKKLKCLGCNEIETATSGEESLQKLKAAKKMGQPFSIAFIDMIMPVMDGWRLSSLINQNSEICDTNLYLIVPEGLMGADAKMKMLDWFDGYLYKPVKRNMLITLLSEIAQTMETAEEELEFLEVVEEECINLEKELAAGITCLIAEDHPINQKLIQTFLTKFGAKVLVASNGKEVVDIVSKENNIDIIFMDIQMPIMDGTQATKEIRKMGYKGIIIACTANADKDDNDSYLKGGMNDVLIKPFKKRQIQEALEKWKKN